MSFKHLWLAGAAIVALAGIATAAEARTTAEEDAITRQLNLEQAEKARAAVSSAPARAQQPTDMQDGQGGPQFKGPPRPDEGMTEEDDTDAMREDVPDDANEPDTMAEPEDMTDEDDESMEEPEPGSPPQ